MCSGAVTGLVAFGAVADVGNRFASAAYLVFLPTAASGGPLLAGARDDGPGARVPVAE